MKNQKLYYYLPKAELDRVLDIQEIIATNHYFRPNPETLVWLSFNPQWERNLAQLAGNGENCSIVATRIDIVAETDIPFRIQVDPRMATHDWNSYFAHIYYPMEFISAIAKFLLST